MTDPKILKKFGCTTDRLKEIFTAQPYEKGSKALNRDQKIRINKDVKLRKQWEERIQNRITEHINFGLQNHQLYGAVDLAWDSAPINKQLYPLMLYAQGKIDAAVCAKDLATAKCADKFVIKDKNGIITGIDLPKFTDVYVNVLRSVITRRLAAQCAKYNNLWPFFRYESRSTSQVGKLRADIMSSLSDIMADQFDYRSHHEQVYRDTLLYGHSVSFIRCAWESEKTMVRKGETAEMSTGEINAEEKITREGLSLCNPHVTRVFADNEYPIRSINSDCGCSYIGYWDVTRAGTVRNNTMFWNRDQLQWSTGQSELFSTFSSYFNRYFCTIKPPPCPGTGTYLQGYGNDRKNQVGMYSGIEEDTSMVICNYFEKLIPSECDLGDYPYPVWVRFVVAGYTSVIFAEFLPSTPAAVCSYNENDSRAVSISVGHELLSYQDQMTNLLSYLLLAIRNDTVKIIVIDNDLMTPEQIEKVRNQIRGKNYHIEPIVIELSRSQKEEEGFDVTKAVQIVETRSQVAIDVIFRAMAQLMSLMERLMAMSPQEQGQPAEREISATESNAISRTTENVYNFISDAFDSYRAALKRMIFESYMAFGRQNFEVPVMNRYTAATVMKAGFRSREDDPVDTTADEPRPLTVLGTKAGLVHDYVFTSRDGAERASDLQGAQYLAEGLKSFLPLLTPYMTKNQLFETVNEFFRKSGAYDMKLEVQDGTGDELISGEGGDMTGVLEQLTATVEQQGQSLQQLQQMLAQLTGGGAAPATNGNGASRLAAV